MKTPLDSISTVNNITGVSKVSDSIWTVAGSVTLPNKVSVEHILLDCGSADVTLTLPPVATNQGKILRITRKYDTTFRTYYGIIVANGSEKIGNSLFSRYCLYRGGAGIVIAAVGTKWEILESNGEDNFIGMISISHNNWMSWNGTYNLGPGTNPPSQYNLIKMYDGNYVFHTYGMTTVSQNSTITYLNHYYNIYINTNRGGPWAKQVGVAGAPYDAHYHVNNIMSVSATAGTNYDMYAQHSTTMTGGSGSLTTGSLAISIFKSL